MVRQHTTRSTDSEHEQTGASAPEVVALLSEIRDLLDRQERIKRQEDFSFLRLFGALAQMLAIVMALWGLFAMFEAQTVDFAVARFAMAIFFQLVTLTTFVVEQKR